jgi:hypothetical protein
VDRWVGRDRDRRTKGHRIPGERIIVMIGEGERERRGRERNGLEQTRREDNTL